ncbi:MAG: sugar phosphate nucleotidyltransferase [Anaerotignaceae bacterium]
MDKDCVCVKPLDDMELVKQFGVANVAADNKVLEIEEKPQAPKSNLVVYATYMYKQETIPYFQQYKDGGNKLDAPGYFVEWLCKNKDVYAFAFNEECYDVGTPASLKEVSAIFEKLARIEEEL